MNLNNNRLFLYLLLSFIINLMQAFFSPIIQDEAYYSFFSNHIGWGFFDSPPMIAIIIKLSSFFFENELGIRFLTVCINTINIYLIWLLIPEKNKIKKYSVELFFIILFALPLLNVYSFITTPDVPLLFFCTIFLLLIIRIKEKPSLLISILLGVTSALIIYSKYHGGVFILICVLSQISILKKKYIYIAGIIGAILILPHVYWQYQNDFISFQYHLLQRNKIGFDPFHILHGSLSIFGVLNPFLLMILLFNYRKTSTSFKKRNLFFLKVFLFFTSFFLLYTLRARIEAHWVALASIPLLLLIHDLTINYDIVKKTVIACFSTIGIILIARILITLPIDIKSEFHRQGSDYFNNVISVTKNTPVLYANSYQKASKHLFYTGNISYSLNNYLKRKNHYDIIDLSENFHNKTVYIVGNSSKLDANKHELEKGKYTSIRLIENFQLFSKLEPKFDSNQLLSLTKKGELKFVIENPYNYSINLNEERLSYKFSILFVDNMGNKNIFPINLLNKDIIHHGENELVASYDLKDLAAGEYTFSVLLEANNLHPQSLGLKKTIAVVSE